MFHDVLGFLSTFAGDKTAMEKCSEMSHVFLLRFAFFHFPGWLTRYLFSCFKWKCCRNSHTTL